MRHRKTARKRARIQRAPRQPKTTKRSPIPRPTRATARCRSVARSAPPAPHAHPRHRRHRTTRKREPPARRARAHRFPMHSTGRSRSQPPCARRPARAAGRTGRIVRTPRVRAARPRRPACTQAPRRCGPRTPPPPHGSRRAGPLSACRTCSHTTTTSSPQRADKHDRASCASLGLRASSAQVGHTVAHVPQPTHFDASTISRSSTRAMHPDVHASAHFRHATLRLRTLAQRSWRTRIATLSTSTSTPTMLRLPMRRAPS